MRTPPPWVETLDTSDWELPGRVTRVLVVANTGQTAFHGTARLDVDFRTRATPPVRLETKDGNPVDMRIVGETVGPVEADGKRRWTFSLDFPVDVPAQSVTGVRAVWGEPGPTAEFPADTETLVAWETTCHPGLHPLPGPFPSETETQSGPLPGTTIAIPTINRPELLRAAIESALAQTVPDIEIVVGDDSDDDLALEVVESFADPRIRLLRHRPPLGQAGNTNACFDAARGNTIVLLHDDDLLMPDCVESLRNVFAQDPETRIAFGRQAVIHANGTRDEAATHALNTHYRRVPECVGVQPSPIVSVVTGQIPSNGWMVNTDDARRVRFRDYAEVGDACDFDFTHRVVQLGGHVHYVDRELSAYRLSQGSVSRRRGFSIETTYEVIRDARVPPEFEALRNQAEGERALIAAHGYLDRGRTGDAWRAWCSPAVPLRARCTPVAARLLLRLVGACLNNPTSKRNADNGS